MKQTSLVTTRVTIRTCVYITRSITGVVQNGMCEDWELGVLFLRECERLGSEEAAADSVRNKFLGELCRKDKDPRFFMGTRFPYNTWLVVGVCWPPTTRQPSLF